MLGSDAEIRYNGVNGSASRAGCCSRGSRRLVRPTHRGRNGLTSRSDSAAISAPTCGPRLLWAVRAIQIIAGGQPRGASCVMAMHIGGDKTDTFHPR